MWHTPEGDRVLTNAEWQVFAYGLSVLRDQVELDIVDGCGLSHTGVSVFDAQDLYQRLCLLAWNADALRNPNIPCPELTAVTEGTVAAVFATFRLLLRMEIDSPKASKGTHSARKFLLQAASGWEVPLPRENSRKFETWDFMLEYCMERILWDLDFELADEILDAPPDVSAAQKAFLQIEDEYFMSTPDEPSPEQVQEARQTLTKLLMD